MTIMQLLGLDGDCLAEIFSVCTKSSLFALCCTSSRVNMLATPYLLRSVEIDGGVEEIASFLNLIITGNRRLLDPGTHVRTLKFTTGAFKAWLANKRLPPPMFNWRPQRPREFNWGLALTGALGLMPNLRSFEMQEGIGYLLSDQLAFTLMSRPRLRCLMLGGVGPSSADLLGQVMSLATPVSLRCLAIANGHIGMDNLDIAEGAGRVLVEARDNLIEVSLSGYRNLPTFTCHENPQNQPDDPIAAISSTAQVLFPHVTTLNISRCRILYNLLPKSFPALRILSICDSEVVTHTASPTDTTTTSDCHHVIFPGLYSLSGNLRHIRTILRPQRRYDALRRLDIHINPAEGPNTETYKTDHFLSLLPTMPNLNSLHIWLCKYNDSQSWHNLVNQCSHLTFLHVGAHPLAPPSTSFKFMVRLLKYVCRSTRSLFTDTYSPLAFQR